MKIKFFILIGMISLQASFAQEVKDSTLVTREIEKNAEKTQLQLIQLDKDKKAAQEATLQAQKDAEKAAKNALKEKERAQKAAEKAIKDKERIEKEQLKLEKEKLKSQQKAEKATWQNALNIKRLGVPLEIISQGTGLSVEEIKNL